MLWAGAAARTGLYKFPEGLRKQGGNWRIYPRCYRHLYEVALSLPLPIRADAGRGGADSMKSGEKSTLSRAPRSSEWIREDNEGAARRVWPYRKHWKRDPGVPGLGCTVLYIWLGTTPHLVRIFSTSNARYLQSTTLLPTHLSLEVWMPCSVYLALCTNLNSL